jgi:hypothetical protein
VIFLSRPIQLRHTPEHYATTEALRVAHRSAKTANPLYFEIPDQIGFGK